MEMGQGDWAIQLEEEYGKLEDSFAKELRENVSKVLGVANIAEDVIF